MAKEPTKEELMALWNRMEAQKAKDKVRTKVNALAVKMLIAAHPDEYETFQTQASQQVGS